MGLSLDTSEQVLSNDEKAQLAQLVSEMRVIKDQMTQVAVILDQLSQASVAQREQSSKWEAQLSEIKPSLQAMKVHGDSFPHALREARRSDAATQKTVEALSTRLRDLESRLNMQFPSSGPRQ
jgi:chromosome segregation ATPase